MQNFALREFAAGRLKPAPKEKPFEPEYDAASWLEPLVVPAERSELIKKSAATLATYQQEHKFDAIAVRGYSGISIGSILSFLLDVPCIMVRKTHSHDHRMAFGLANARNYIIVDDFVASGETVRAIHGLASDLASGAGRWGGPSTRDPAKLSAVFTYGRDYRGFKQHELCMGEYRGLLKSGADDPIEDVPLLDLLGRPT
jgi:hypothetical protein